MNNYEWLKKLEGKDLWISVDFYGENGDRYLFGIDDCETPGGYIHVLDVNEDNATVHFNLMSRYTIEDHELIYDGTLEAFEFAMEHPTWAGNSIRLDISDIIIDTPVTLLTTDEIRESLAQCPTFDE